MRIWPLFLLPILLVGDEVPHMFPKGDTEIPWLTGPLLAPTPLVVPLGHFYFEPYQYLIADTGKYDGDWKPVKGDTLWTSSFQPFMQIGLASWLDLALAPALNYNYTKGAGDWAFSDLPVLLEIQLHRSSLDEWWPDVKLALKEFFPTGKYRRLDPKKKGTDIGGGGSFQTGLNLVVGKLIHLKGIHFMTARLSLLYTIPSAVRLKGLSAYGGASDTNARLFPGQSLLADLAFEISLSQNWALACDFVGIWAGKTCYSGYPGRAAALGSGSSVQYQIAPAFEYNWSSNIGIIAGGWFTVGGRNSPRFAGFSAAFSYYI